MKCQEYSLPTVPISWKIRPDSSGEYLFEPVITSEGCYGAIFQGERTNDGTKVAFKSLTGRRETKAFILNQVRTYSRLTAQVPFLPVLGVAEGTSGYVMKLGDGASVAKRLRHGPNLTNTERIRAVRAYAQAMTLTHEQGVLLGDNNWGKVLLGDLEITVCDHDFMGTPADLTFMSPLRCLFDPETASREWVLRFQYGVAGVPEFTKGSDQESFGYMIDFLFSRWYLSNVNGQRRAEATMNRRTIPEDHLLAAPLILRPFLSAWLNYPRDDSVTAATLLDELKGKESF